MTSSAGLRVIEEDLRAVLNRELPWQALSGRRIVVTGAGGFLGGYLVRVLLALHRAGKIDAPLQVVAPVRNVERAKVRLSDCAHDPQLTLMRWDLNDIAVPELGDVHYVIHNASQASPKYYGADPMGTMLPNTVGTSALLEALRRSSDPKGLLFVSSSEIYGAVSSEQGLREQDYGIVDPMGLRACYAESKRAGEALCVAFHHQHGIPTWVVRPFHTYGPGLAADDGRVFSDFAYNVARNEHIVMNSDGTARRAFCYASDAVAGFFTVLLRGDAAQAYNVANEAAELSVMEFAEMLVGLFPEKALKVERRVVVDPAGYLRSTVNRIVPDTTRLQALGWRAEVTPAQGFKRMIETLE
ncbi:NAD-dependent epimerase/dehydratase family protein [Roseateles chitinivorans]|uniref:NAD-dependent epimerase/dehydratase family protein n=1 Tax=Roseateles chitinivorans TaxID=2917965 RepID=UPI003D6760AF